MRGGLWFIVLFGCWVEFAVSEANGGTKCAACTILARMIEMSVDEKIGNNTLEMSIGTLCSLVTGENDAKKLCHSFLHSTTEARGEMLEGFNVLLQDNSPDQICANLGACTNISYCPLYPGKEKSSSSTSSSATEGKGRAGGEMLFSISSYLQNLISNISYDLNAHIPVGDRDNDMFSGYYETLRGRNWRGRDCEPTFEAIYPGRLPHNSDKVYDGNCNGISGFNSTSGVTYEEQFCSQEQRGLMILGDSIGAHFALPTSWYFISKGAYENFFYTLANEVCWPQMSTYTGFVDYTGAKSGWGDCPDTWQGTPCTMSSIYMKMRENNLCIHRDYQNLAVSGADSSLAVGNVHAIARNQSLDRPALFFYALIGDDICDHKSASGWTTPEKFRSNVLTTLDFLNSTLPANSAVVLVGLVDGRVLWDINHDREYPLGGGVTYEDFWGFLNCLEISYCYGWLNSDPAVRNAATTRANELNDELIDIAQNLHYVNFEMDYYPYPLTEAAAKYVKKGGRPSDLIEPFDGLHASQIANSLIADEFVEKLERDHPDWLGLVNPNNDQIKKMFGEQGGH